MLDKLLSAAAANAKLAIAAAAGAALVAGGSAAVVVQNVSDSNATGVEASGLQGDNRSATATANIGKPKPATGTADITPGGAHGACVSFVAKDKEAVVDGNHGKAVSAAAKSCPKGNDDVTATETEDAGKGAAGKATAEEKKKAAEAKRSAATSDDADDDTPRGSRETGTERSGGRPTK